MTRSGAVQVRTLWPDWESLDALERKRRVVGARDWSALYQQRPAPEEGDYFKADWLRPYTVRIHHQKPLQNRRTVSRSNLPS
jgi:hypothetical protein